jgi:hypothetical protein
MALIDYMTFHPISKTDHNQNGPLPKRTVNFFDLWFIDNIKEHGVCFHSLSFSQWGPTTVQIAPEK